MITPTQNVFLIVILTLFCLFSIFPGVQLFRIWLNRYDCFWCRWSFAELLLKTFYEVLSSVIFDFMLFLGFLSICILVCWVDGTLTVHSVHKATHFLVLPCRCVNIVPHYCYRIPANIQFAMFSLLLIFFTRMLYKKQWYKYKSRCWIAFWVTNAILALIIACEFAIVANTTFRSVNRLG